MNEPKAYFDPEQDHVLVSTDDLKSWNEVFQEREKLRELVCNAAPTAWAHGADVDGAVEWEKRATALLRD